MDCRSSEALSLLLRCFLDLEFLWTLGHLDLSWEAICLLVEQRMDLHRDFHLDSQDRVQWAHLTLGQFRN